ncbi:MAG TPA: methyltransferase domain-containing protein [Candidatus Hydrogenedentes bacterium]|nr:methyltransferase domain-containing protein [Candidatus Hydrogenedentota bacterium]
MQENNRFQDFFEDPRYVALKNYLYNYRLRKRSINKVLKGESEGWTLEAGSGLTPIITNIDRIVYSELSFLALKTLRQIHPRGLHVVADATCLPFKTESFSRVVCSEVLEHIPEDRRAIEELARMVSPDGDVVITFPHRKCYFTFDDYFVKHLRRYELEEMAELLQEAGLHPKEIKKVLGPLEKIISLILTHCFAALERQKRVKPLKKKSTAGRSMVWTFKWINWLLAWVVRLDAFLVPRQWSTVLLIRTRKK